MTAGEFLDWFSAYRGMIGQRRQDFMLARIAHMLSVDASLYDFLPFEHPQQTDKQTLAADIAAFGAIIEAINST